MRHFLWIEQWNFGVFFFFGRGGVLFCFVLFGGGGAGIHIDLVSLNFGSLVLPICRDFSQVFFRLKKKKNTNENTSGLGIFNHIVIIIVISAIIIYLLFSIHPIINKVLIYPFSFFPREDVLLSLRTSLTFQPSDRRTRLSIQTQAWFRRRTFH